MLLAINVVQPNTLTIDDHDFHNTVSIDLATLAFGIDPPTNESKCLPF